MYIIAIDPGISGSICFYEKGRITEILDMPTMTDGKKNKKQVNGSQVYNEINSRINSLVDKNDIRVVIEQVSAMPGQGVTSMFNFGQSFGVLKGVCSAMQLPMYFVRPAKWKKYFNLINSEKDASRTKAIQIFPYISSKLSRKKDANKADAILIACFFYETYKSKD
ncbi:MAG: crossover junction endodeoxyribonuclease [Candidatus Pelagibacter sp. TMED273]|nr:MAG: crossover junction endodeoxyribonuclease [Candidatus Pelagibacter sp. TMED273]|tara:strand:- start:3857 stop:4354 length:498 start_codon:yes stop_codon:yes gene_type:complete